MSRTLSYPPPWQDAPTLCAHICVSERTLDAWVRQGLLPPPRERGGKRMWKWSEVEQKLEGDEGIVPGAVNPEDIYHATKKYAAGSR